MKPDIPELAYGELKKAVAEALIQMEVFRQASRLIPVQVDHELAELVSKTRLLLHQNEGESDSGVSRPELVQKSSPAVFRRVGSIRTNGKPLFRSVFKPVSSVNKHRNTVEPPEKPKPRKRKPNRPNLNLNPKNNKDIRPLKPAARIPRSQLAKTTEQPPDIQTSSNLRLKQ